METTQKALEILRTGTPEQKAAMKKSIQEAAALAAVNQAGLRLTSNGKGDKWTVTGSPDQFVALLSDKGD